MEESYTIKQYKKFRSVGMELNSKLFEHLDKTTLTKCAFLLDVIDDTGSFVFDSDADADSLSDFSIHDYINDNGETELKIFAESDMYEALSKDEKVILQAKLNSFQSLFLVDYIKPDEAILGLKDVFNGYQSIEIIDFGLSESLYSKKTYIYTRIMQFEDFSCTTGIAYVFEQKNYLKVKKSFSKQLKKYSMLKNRTRKSVAIYHVNKLYGLEMVYGELK